MDQLICQSCGFSFPKSISGSNRDGSECEDYCENCYKDGEFVEHSLSMHQHEVRIIEMAKLNEVTFQEAQQIIKTLPNLKRWKMNNI